MSPHPILRCNCQRPLCWQDENTADASLQWLSCQHCHRYIPIINNFVLFTEEVQQQQDLPDELLTLFHHNHSNYPLYLAQKKARQILEVYAALQPFNEASRVLFPLLPALQQALKPGDIIVDSWDRSGWHGLLLSALFPQQHVISLWDSNSSVLGYAGYDWWFSSANKPTNLDVMFVPANTQLPFATDSVAFVFAHDVLHRYPFADYPNELERICQQSGIILYAHVHLSNSEPMPWFQRGGTLRSSEFYRDFFSDQLRYSSRDVKVLSEVGLFNLSSGVLEQAVDEQHYNGTIVIAPQRWLAQSFDSSESLLSPDCRCILNPLFIFNPFNRQVALNQSGLSGQTAYFLTRHPCLKARVQHTVGQRLQFDEAELLLASQSGDCIAELAEQRAWSITKALAYATSLQQRELLLALPVTRQALALQDFHSNDHKLCPLNFAQFWQDVAPNFTELSVSLEGEVLSYQEVTQLIQALAAWLVAEQLQGTVHINALLDPSQRIVVLLACWWLGLVPVLACDELSFQENDVLNPSKHRCSLNQFWQVIERYVGECALPNSSIPNVAIDKQQTIPWYQMLMQLLREVPQH